MCYHLFLLVCMFACLLRWGLKQKTAPAPRFACWQRAGVNAFGSSAAGLCHGASATRLYSSITSFFGLGLLVLARYVTRKLCVNFVKWWFWLMSLLLLRKIMIEFPLLPPEDYRTWICNARHAFRRRVLRTHPACPLASMGVLR